jgi:DNA invertase Pin-like site-specific DNA recombinase
MSENVKKERGAAGAGRRSKRAGAAAGNGKSKAMAGAATEAGGRRTSAKKAPPRAPQRKNGRIETKPARYGPKPRPAPAGLIYHRVDDPDAKQRVVREAVEFILGLPQPDPDAPKALLAPLLVGLDERPADWQTLQCPVPLGYREVAKAINLVGWDVVADSSGEQLARAVAEALHDDPAEIEREVEKWRAAQACKEDMSRPRRPATERPKRRPPTPYQRPTPKEPKRRVTADEAAKEVALLLGDAYVPVRGGDAAVSYVWDARMEGASKLLDPRGDTIVCTRKSSDETQNGQTTRIGQFDPCWALCGAEGLKPRMVIVSECLSGVWDFEFRTDFMLGLDAIRRGGWVRNVVWYCGDRIARDVPPGERYYAELRNDRVNLWLASWGRRVRWTGADKLQLRIENTLAAHYRDDFVGKTQYQRMLQGPLAGNGWKGKPPPGAWWNPETRRLEQYEPVHKHIRDMFGLLLKGASTRETAEELERNGCPFDHDRIRTLAKDKIYVTGEYAVNVRGIAVAQRPIRWDNPIPADEWHEVQVLLGGRKGRANRTPDGEFVLNAVKLTHARCAGTKNPKGITVRISGYYLRNENGSTNDHLARYRHSTFTPDCCKHQGYTWEREDLERPVIDLARKVLRDPDVLDGYRNAIHYEIDPDATVSAGSNRAQWELDLANLTARRVTAQAELRQHLVSSESTQDEIELHKQIVLDINHEISRLERYIKADDEASTQDVTSMRELRRQKRLEAALELLTHEVPTDPRKRRLRARLLQSLVSEVIIHEDDEGRTWLEVKGHLQSSAIPSLDSTDPVDHVSDLLDAYASRKAKEAGEVPMWEVAVPAVPGLQLAEASWVEGEAHAAKEVESEEPLLMDSGTLRKRANEGDPQALRHIAAARRKAEELGIPLTATAGPTFQTDSGKSTSKSVRKLAPADCAKELLERPSIQAQVRAARRDLDSTSFLRRVHAEARNLEGRSPFWSAAVEIEVAAGRRAA